MLQMSRAAMVFVDHQNYEGMCNRLNKFPDILLLRDYLKIQLDIFNYNMGLLSSYESILKRGASTGSAGASVSNAKAAGPAIP